MPEADLSKVGPGLGLVVILNAVPCRHDHAADDASSIRREQCAAALGSRPVGSVQRRLSKGRWICVCIQDPCSREP